jgi:ppGpp synthetase/RelA/SpoT-type nucleotidyltranferase
MKAKTFDCVEMMHRGAEEIKKKIRRMTKKEEVEFWRERSKQLRRLQSKAEREGKHEPPVP